MKYIKKSSVSTLWSSWTALPTYGLLGERLAVTTFGSGTNKQLMLFFLNADNNLCYSLQTSSGGFINGPVLNGSDVGFPTPQFAVGKNSQGNVVIVAAGTIGNIFQWIQWKPDAPVSVFSEQLLAGYKSF